MTGGMSAADVTAENYPELFALKDALAELGIESVPRPFDVYQGPYLDVPAAGAVVWQVAWQVDDWRFVIERGFAIGNPGMHERKGADTLSGAIGLYSSDSAARRLAKMARKRDAKRRCAACDAPLFAMMRVHHHTENGEDVTS